MLGGLLSGLFFGRVMVRFGHDANRPRKAHHRRCGQGPARGASERPSDYSGVFRLPQAALRGSWAVLGGEKRPFCESEGGHFHACLDSS
jgi:hypothetical protein